MPSSLFSLIILLSFSPIFTLQSHPINSSSQSHNLDLFIRDYTFKSYDFHLKTGIVQAINLPANFSGIKVNTARFRCGSLRRYGAQIKEFNLGIGVIIQPCVERVMLISQNLGVNLSSKYYSNYDLKGYKLVSPILGLLAYNAGTDKSFNLSNPFELQIIAGEKPISINFTNFTSNLIRAKCASFEDNGKVTLKDVSNNVCVTTRNGHYGLVVKSAEQVVTPATVTRKISLWKVVVGSTVGSVLGVFLLCLLLVAMFVKVKKKAKMEEMERRAYEEEALQVSMVGHVRAPTASVTRTLPTTIEHERSKHDTRNINNDKRRKRRNFCG
ncbi:uncharacterized protein [Euphorbia lathyris]|uniref:uncharacterized protein n=1 Tax=Euphorbia lathyris TaxID=212925 RepID=UPI0033141C01